MIRHKALTPSARAWLCMSLLLFGLCPLQARAVEPVSYQASPEDASRFHKPIAVYSQGQVSLFSGTYNTAMTLSLPPARAGLVPEVRLEYSSDAAPSMVGRGWSISLDHISRSLRRGVPRYQGPGQDTGDELEFSLGGHFGPLVCSGQVQSGVWLYRPKREGAFAKFYYFVSSGEWKVLDRSGRTWVMGTTGARDQDSGKVFAWFVSSITDGHGNKIEHTYTSYKGNLYPTCIRYDLSTQATVQRPNVVTFDWLDSEIQRHTSYRKGYRAVLDARYLLEIRIEAFDEQTGQDSYRRHFFSYNWEASGSSSVNLVEILPQSPMPKTTFTYQGPSTSFDQNAAVVDPMPTQSGDDQYNLSVLRKHGTASSYELRTTSMLVDMDGDGDLDMLLVDSYRDNPGLYSGTNNWFWRKNVNGAWDSSGYRALSGPEPVIAGVGCAGRTDCNQHLRQEKYSAYHTKRYADLFDITGDGLPDFVFVHSSALYVAKGNGCKTAGSCFDAPTVWTAPPELCNNQPLSTSREDGTFGWDLAAFLDMNGDGLPDYVWTEDSPSWPSKGYLMVHLNTGSAISSSVSYSMDVGDCWELGQSTPGTCLRSYETIASYNVSHIVRRDLRDMNGDGLLDLLMETTLPSSGCGTTRIYFGTGSSFDSTNYLDHTGGCLGSSVGPNTENVTKYENMGIYDVNGDGLPDKLVYVAADNKYKVYLNNGNGFNPVQVWSVSQGACSSYNYLRVTKRKGVTPQIPNGATQYIVVKQDLLDFDGDGQIEILTAYPNQDIETYSSSGSVINPTLYSPWCRRGTSGRPVHRAKSITSEGGMRITLEYDRPTQSGSAVPFPLWAVSLQKRYDSTIAFSSDSYIESFDPLYDVKTKELRGFKRARVNESNQRLVEYEHKQGEFDQGNEVSRTIKDLSGVKLHEVITTYSSLSLQSTPAERQWVRPSKVTTKVTDPGAAIRTTEVEYTYFDTDPKKKYLGLVKTIWDKGYTDSDLDDRTDHLDYVYKESEGAVRKRG